MTGPDDTSVVGFAELSATAVRARLLDAHDRFWDTDTRALHHPVWFHQFGGFGALARTSGGEDVGYVLGVVTADRLGRLLDHADIVKVSAEDLAWLEPGTTGPDALDAAARSWAARGPAIVLVTDGAAPLRIARPGHAVLHWRTPRVAVVDTVGAGDSLAAGLLSGLLESGVTDRAALEALPDEELLRLVDDAALVAALNCTRVGADPPTRAEFTAARAER